MDDVTGGIAFDYDEADHGSVTCESINYVENITDTCYRLGRDDGWSTLKSLHSIERTRNLITV